MLMHPLRAHQLEDRDLANPLAECRKRKFSVEYIGRNVELEIDHGDVFDSTFDNRIRNVNCARLYDPIIYMRT